MPAQTEGGGLAVAFSRPLAETGTLELRNMLLMTLEGTLIKGTSILARMTFMQDHLDRAQAAEVLSTLSSEDRELLSGIVLPVGQYSLALASRLDDAIARALTPTDLKRTYRALGRASANVGFDSFHGGLVTTGDPHAILERIGIVRRLYYSEGTARYARLGATKGRFIISGMLTVTTADCESTAGYFEAAIERSGGRRALVAHACCLRGEADCLFDCSWSAARA